MKKKITLLCSSFPPEKGAAPNRMYHLANLLQQNDYDVTVIAAMPNYPTGNIFEAYKGKVICKEKINNISVIRTWLIPTHSSKKIWRIISLLSYSLSLLTLGFWHLIRSKPDLIYISTPPFVIGHLGGKMARILGVKTILNISDIWPQSAYDLGYVKKGFFYNYLLKKEKSMYLTPIAFTVQSSTIQQHLFDQGISKPTFLYRNLSDFQDQNLSLRPKGKRKIIYSGLLGVAQGLFNILKDINFEEIGTELHIYGQGKELKEIEQFINTNPNRGIYLHPSVSPSELSKIFQAFHIMLIPLSKDIKGAVPSKIFYAMANALPILFCGNGEGAEIILNFEIGLTSEAGNTEKLIENIKNIIQKDQIEYEAMCKKCINTYQNHFNKKDQDKSFLNFLNQI